MNPLHSAPEEDALRRLVALGATALRHVNGDLLLHLKGTYEVLQRWEAPTHVCLAGLYHAVYGTAGFADQLLSLDRRPEVAALIGSEAEELVYVFSACDRPDFYPHLQRREQPPLFRNRFTGQASALAPSMLASFCELTLANEVEIVLKMNAARRPSHSRLVAALLPALGPYASTAAVRECRALLAGGTLRTAA